MIYDGQNEGMAIRFERWEYRNEASRNIPYKIYYEEIYRGQNNGTYILTIGGDGSKIISGRYIRKRDNREFELEIIE